MIEFRTLHLAQALTFAFDDEEAAGIKTFDCFTENLHNVVVLPSSSSCSCSCFCSLFLTLVSNFCSLEYGIHFQGGTVDLL